MAARPPQDDAEEPDSITFGIAALDGRFDSSDLTFPADQNTIVDALGDPEIPYDPSGQSIALSDALDHTRQEEFDTEDDLLDALHPVFEERRRSASTGLLGRLRALF